MASNLPRVPADLTHVPTNGGRGYAHTTDWDHDTTPAPGVEVVAVGKDDVELSAVVDRVTPDGMLVLLFPQFQALPELRVDPGVFAPDGLIETGLPWHLVERLQPGDQVRVVADGHRSRVCKVLAISADGKRVRLAEPPASSRST